MHRIGSALLLGMPVLTLERDDRHGSTPSRSDEVRDLAAELYSPGRLSIAGIGPDEAQFHRCQRRRCEGRAIAHDLASRRRRRGPHGTGGLPGGRCRPRHGAAGRADPALGDEPRRGARRRPTCVVDFTTPQTGLENALACLRAGVHVVVGTTGFDPRRSPGRRTAPATPANA